MTTRTDISRLIIRFPIILGLLLLCPAECLKSQKPDESVLTAERISSEIARKLAEGDTTGLLRIGENYSGLAQNNLSDSVLRSDLYYYSGVCFLLVRKYYPALSCLKSAGEFKKSLGIVDDRFMKSIYNTGVAYNYLGDLSNSAFFFSEFIEKGKEFYGMNNPEVASAYSALIGALIENKDYERLNHYIAEALEMLKTGKDLLTSRELGDLYQNIGLGYYHIADYAKVKVYLEQALEYFDQANLKGDENYINLINNLASTYGFLGMTGKETEFFEKGIVLAVQNNSDLAFNLINTYAIECGNSGKVEKGEKLLFEVLLKARDIYGTDSRFYITVLMNYAEYLRIYKDDAESAVPLFLVCLDYVEKHKEDILLRDPVIIGYSLALSKKGKSQEALRMIQDLLFQITKPGSNFTLYENPDQQLIPADKRLLRILKSKHEILTDIYSRSSSPEVLEAAANTSESIIFLIGRIRSGISEEASRIVLGDNYRNLYVMAIRDFELCYNLTGDVNFLEKAFEYMERSKAAGFLAATREMNAVQFSIPPGTAGLEKSLQREIGFLNSKIAQENEKAVPDKKLLAAMNGDLLKNINLRDSLVGTFEKDFPGYYTMKYSDSAPLMKEIPSITGRNTNYLNYLVSDSVIYIFLVNRKHQEFIAQPVDSLFFQNLKDFRFLLSNPSKRNDARTRFNEYQALGLDLYKTLIAPVKDYLVSDKLLISPDNLLSYIPFEVLVTSEYSGKELLYRELNYLMDDFDISYAYSATFIRELMNRRPGKNKNLIAFAPVYGTDIIIDSLLANRQTQNNILFDLPFSREEAEYVSAGRNGKLCIGSEARESEYKKTAGKYGIIHLAMHTLLNDQIPMNSAMVFTLDDDSPEDGLLYSYEVYGIPLKAMMVVLSSCNTGSGMLSTGEGILSLARGFLYSGSQSVVMSMWEIDDKSGTEIVKMFYDNLKKGKTKSRSLKHARMEYLRNASQLRSHPYYWSALVIYGDNTPIRSTARSLIIMAGIVLLAAPVLLFYLRNRRYS